MVRRVIPPTSCTCACVVHRLLFLQSSSIIMKVHPLYSMPRYMSHPLCVSFLHTAQVDYFVIPSIRSSKALFISSLSILRIYLLHGLTINTKTYSYLHKLYRRSIKLYNLLRAMHLHKILTKASVWNDIRNGTGRTYIQPCKLDNTFQPLKSDQSRGGEWRRSIWLRGKD